jgi:chromosome segregation ATPase
MNNETELVWVPKELAQKIKDVNGNEETDRQILSYVAEMKDEIRNYIANIDDDIIQFRAAMIKAKQQFKEAKDAELKELNSLWENADGDISSARDKIKSIASLVEPLKKELAEVKAQMADIRNYDIENLLKLLEQVSNYLQYDGDTGKVLRFLFANYGAKK